MRRLIQFIKEYIGRKKTERIRTKKIESDYRKYKENEEKLENGEWI